MSTPRLLYRLSYLPFTIYHTLKYLLFMTCMCLEFVQCHLFCTRNHSNSNQTTFKILPLCLRTYFHLYDHVKVTSPRHGKSVTVSAIHNPRCIYVTTSTALRMQEWPKVWRKVPMISFFLNGGCLVCLLIGLLVVWWKRHFHFHIHFPLRVQNLREGTWSSIESIPWHLFSFCLFSPLFNIRIAVNWAYRVHLISF